MERTKYDPRERRDAGFRRVKVWVQRVRNRRAVLIAYWEAENIERVVREMAESQDPFDVWSRDGGCCSSTASICRKGLLGTLQRRFLTGKQISLPERLGRSLELASCDLMLRLPLLRNYRQGTGAQQAMTKGRPGAWKRRQTS
jgi:hypothetical protein